MAMTFFDCIAPFSRPGITDVDRVYRLAWHDYDDRTWESIGTIYPRLPGWCGYATIRSRGWRGWLGCTESGPPFWFGTDETSAPHLTASVEPPGLQVTGQLSASVFAKWHEQFFAAIAEFPAGEPN